MRSGDEIVFLFYTAPRLAESARPGPRSLRAGRCRFDNRSVAQGAWSLGGRP